MFAVDLSTFIAIVIVLLSIIFCLLIFRSKPTNNQVLEMKEVGAEIVQQIQNSVQQYEKEKVELKRQMEEMKRWMPVQGGTETSLVLKEQQSQAKNESNSEIVRMHREGYKVEEIAKMLNIQRGIIEVSLNFENLEAR